MEIGRRNSNDMPSRRRELYFRIIDNQLNIHPIAHRLHFLDNHFPQEKLDRALYWLCNNNHVGKSFLRWFREECKNSDLEMHRLLLAIVKNEELAPVVAGKNFKL